MTTNEKKTEAVKVWMDERLFVDLNRLAILDDRKLSEYINVILTRHVYGHGTRPQQEPEGPKRGE